ncbi:unnamed protein product [Clavelina lepadiformis]|uniref:ER membrane protein complex subunit 4 n=1 Tax=Clavelina lepadiformis TaxID=159417 RepID=A0ABP0GCY9_CLALP
MHNSSVQNRGSKSRKDKWAIDLKLKKDQVSVHELPSPPGYLTIVSSSTAIKSKSEDEGHSNVVNKRSWDTALAPIKALALAVYKCNSMGLLPTHASDWLAFISPLQRMEYVGGGITAG